MKQTKALQNWQNLIELYEHVARASKDIRIINEQPYLSFFPVSMSWPNFTIIKTCNGPIFDKIISINKNIEEKKVSPFVLLSPDCIVDEELTNSFYSLGIRKIAEWPLISYINNKLTSINVEGLCDLEVVSTKDCNDFCDWAHIVSSVLFSGGDIPTTALGLKEFKLILAKKDHKPVGTAMIFFGKTSASVHMVSVLPEYRGMGIGKMIFKHAIQMVFENGYGMVFAQATPMGRKPWLDIGFVIDGQIDLYWKIGY